MTAKQLRRRSGPPDRKVSTRWPRSRRARRHDCRWSQPQAMGGTARRVSGDPCAVENDSRLPGRLVQTWPPHREGRATASGLRATADRAGQSDILLATDRGRVCSVVSRPCRPFALQAGRRAPARVRTPGHILGPPLAQVTAPANCSTARDHRYRGDRSPRTTSSTTPPGVGGSLTQTLRRRAYRLRRSRSHFQSFVPTLAARSRGRP